MLIGGWSCSLHSAGSGFGAFGKAIDHADFFTPDVIFAKCS
jgi:hypothetical protein